MSSLPSELLVQGRVRAVCLVVSLVLLSACAGPLPRGTLSEGEEEALQATFEAQRPSSGKPATDLVELVRRVRRGVVLVEVPQAATFGAYLEELGTAAWESLVEFPDLGEILNLPWTLAFGWLDVQDVVLQGSGVLICDHEGQGYLLTNAHVLGDRPARVRVRFDGASQDGYVDAELLWSDPELDVALLRAPLAGSQAKPLPLGVAKPELGRWTMVAGYPVRGDAYAPPNPSVTLGVLSSWDVEIEPFQRPPEVLEPPGLLQTEGAINPGNSGGALLDLSGQVLGIVCSRLEDSDGIGFVIPIQWAIYAMGRDLNLSLRPLGLTHQDDGDPDASQEEEAD